MPWTLWRYILGDLIRSLLLTTFILVTVIAFGAAIKPLAQDHLLGVWQAMKYILFAMVPMLQFALPFAGGFAATLTLHRMASDREIVAAVVSGISYSRLLAPIIGLGLAITLVMVLLTQLVIPRFWTLMERTITADIVGMFEASIGRGLPFRVGDLQIYADDMNVVQNPAATDADTRIRLLRLAAIELGPDGEVVTEITAYQAAVDVYFREGRTTLQLVLEDALAYNARTNSIFRAPRTDPERGITVPGLLDNDPSACTRSELRELMNNPDQYPAVDEARRRLARALRQVDEWSLLAAQLARDGEFVLTEEGVTDRQYRVRADDLDDGNLRTSDGAPILIIQEDAGVVVGQMEARKARLELNAAATESHIAFDLVATDVRVTTRVESIINERNEVIRRNLLPPPSPASSYADQSSAQLIELAETRSSGEPEIIRRVEWLQVRILEILRESRSHLAKRYALSTTAVLLISLGAILAILLRESPPLTVYLWAFLPSILDLVLISGGEQMINDGKSGGMLVMWSGNMLLFVLCLIAFRRLTRN
ncbi:MAG: LptF/LptG family permease [Phycisphaerales bacterium]|nr:LptF/LptG family permease [Phycisphaerales bacterium]